VNPINLSSLPDLVSASTPEKAKPIPLTNSHQPALNLIAEDAINYNETQFLMEWMEADANMYCEVRSRLLPKTGFNFNNWISQFSKYFIFAENRGFAYHQMVLEPLGGQPAPTLNSYIQSLEDTVRIDAKISRGSLEYCVYGSKHQVQSFEAWMNTLGFREKETMVDWCFGPNYSQMETFKLPLQIPPTIPPAFPWVGTDIKTYAQQFLGSRENILILIGPPGTGKTTFIKELIRAMGSDATVTYDTDLLFSDGFFASFMTSRDSDILVLEDADTVMGSRKEGNTMMHRFLNAADGLVSLAKKKIIFSTNLQSTDLVDPALLRPGRCFEVLHARPLTQVEAQAVADDYYEEKVVLDKSSYTLAEVTNMTGRQRKEARGNMGFY